MLAQLAETYKKGKHLNINFTSGIEPRYQEIQDQSNLVSRIEDRAQCEDEGGVVPEDISQHFDASRDPLDVYTCHNNNFKLYCPSK